MKKVSSKSRADNKIGELIVHPSVDGEAHWRRVETMRERTRSKFREGNRIYDDSSSPVERGRVNTRDKRTLLLALQRRETAPGSRAFDLLLCPDRGTARGGSSRQKIYEPLGNASMLLILSSSIHSRFTKNAGVVCTRQRSSKGNLKKRSDPPYRINHSQSSRTSPIVINILFVFFLARSAIKPVIQINPGEGRGQRIREFPD